MTKIVLTDLGNLQNETTAVNAINNNNAVIETAFDNTLSRDGTLPNQMDALIDMNSHQIINLPVPQTTTSPLRLEDLNSFIGGGTITNIPAGGFTGTVLTKASNDSYDIIWNVPLTNVDDIETYGGVGDGVTPNDAAFEAWWEARLTSGSILRFGKGAYLFNSSIDKTLDNQLQSISIVGAGSTVTSLYWPAGGGMKFTQGNSQNSVHIRDMSIVTSTANVGSAISLNSTQTLGSSVQSDIMNVILRGDDFDDINANVHYWGTGINISGWSDVTAQNINVYGKIGAPGAAGGGIGMKIAGVGGATGPVVGINIFNPIFFFTNIGVQLNSNWEGVAITGGGMGGQVGGGGIYNPPSQTHCGPGLSIINTGFDTGSSQINLQSSVSEVYIFGGSITVSASTGSYGILSLGATHDLTVQGVVFNNAASVVSSTAISYAGSRGAIGGNTFVGYTTGIDISGATNITVGPNTYDSVVTKVIPGSGNTVLEFGTGGTVVYQGNSFTGASINGTSYNNVVIPAPVSTAVIEVASGKHFTMGNTLQLQGTDSTVHTFPSTNSTLARTDAGQTFTGTNVFSSTISGNISGNAATATTATNVTTNANLTGAVTSVGNATSLGSFTSANLATALTDETGSGSNVFSVSPALTGTPTSTTAAVDTNTTQIATTAMVLAQAASATPLAPGTAAVGTSTRYARADHVHPVGAYFSASLSANQSTTSTVFNKVLFNTELADSNNFYDNVTNFRFLPTVAGKYRITASVQASGTTVTEVDVDVYLNGSTYARGLGLAAGTATSTAISKIVSFNGSTDFVEIFAAVTGTGTLNFLGGTGPIRSWFEAQYIGP